MNILSIAIKQLKHNFRDKPHLVIMTIFPLILMLILGTALNGDNIDLNNIEVLYSISNEGEFSKSFIEFIENMDEINISFKEIEDNKKGIENIKNNYSTCYIEINENDDEIKLFKNSRFHFESGFVEGIVGTFVQRYNVIVEIAKVNPIALQSIFSEKNETLAEKSSFVDIKSIDKKNRPRAIDYYGITMLSLIIMYSMMVGASSIKNEDIHKTGNRMIISPMKKYEVFLGKTIGVFLVTMLQMLVVMIFSTKVLEVNWGGDISTIFLIISSEIIMAVSVGIGVGVIIKGEGACNGILNFMIPLMVFLGGGYISINQFNNKILTTLTNVSPVKWVNESIFNVIYAENYEYVKTAVIINLIIALIFLVIASLKFMRKEVL